MTERRKGHGISNGLDNRRGVCNGLDTRRYVEVVIDGVRDSTLSMAIRTPQQQLQPERDPTMAMAMAKAIMAHRQQHCNREERGPATVL